MIKAYTKWHLWVDQTSGSRRSLMHSSRHPTIILLAPRRRRVEPLLLLFFDRITALYFLNFTPYIYFTMGVGTCVWSERTDGSNLYDIRNTLRVVDMPGFGHADAPDRTVEGVIMSPTSLIIHHEKRELFYFHTFGNIL